jgi:hypothetical protein
MKIEWYERKERASESDMTPTIYPPTESGQGGPRHRIHFRRMEMSKEA